ncbi:MAG TPA: DUF1684 domain-containing protein [Gemmatimonadales bacterium]
MARERADFAAWLESAPTSPLGAIARQPIGASLSLGPDDADLPLTGVPRSQLDVQNDRITLSGPDGQRQVRRGVPFRLGEFTLTVDGPTGRVAVTVFGPTHPRHPAQYFPYDADAVFVGRLLPPDRPGTVRLLGLDGVEVDATEAGSVVVPLGNGPTRLRVRWLPTGGEESDLEIYFRDATNGNGTYPAGRFVPLIPVGNSRYRLDFNRARNPFCAYSAAYPCPAPWQGNTIATAVRAGERYAGGGLENVPASR